jgi:hypothetical protein
LVGVASDVPRAFITGDVAVSGLGVLGSELVRLMFIVLKVSEVFRTEQQADVRLADGKGTTMHLRLTLAESKEFEPGMQFTFEIEPILP